MAIINHRKIMSQRFTNTPMFLMSVPYTNRKRLSSCFRTCMVPEHEVEHLTPPERMSRRSVLVCGYFLISCSPRLAQPIQSTGHLTSAEYPAMMNLFVKFVLVFPANCGVWLWWNSVHFLFNTYKSISSNLYKPIYITNLSRIIIINGLCDCNALTNGAIRFRFWGHQHTNVAIVR